MIKLKSVTSRLTVILIAMSVAACGTPQAPSAPTAMPVSTQPPPATTTEPSATPAASPTQAVTPTAEPSRTSTTAAPAPTATTQPPATSSSGDASSLIFPTEDGLLSVSADGTVKQLRGEVRPEFARNLRDALSPNGEWIAFRSGDDPSLPDKPAGQPLTLNLLDLATGEVKPITPLFSAAMEQAIREAAASGDRTDAIEAVIAIIDNGDTLKWSPDGRYVAFIAAIDGPSSDVYSYDRETGQINRLTDGPNQAARLFWSPDSYWIVHEEVASFGTGAGYAVQAVWAAAADGSSTRKLYKAQHSGDEVFVEWVSPDTFFAYSWTAIGWQNVRLVNLTTGDAQQVGPDFPVQTLAYDPQTNAQLYFTVDFTGQQSGLPDGLYLAEPDAIDQPRFIADGSWYATDWLPQTRLFFAAGKEGVLSVTREGIVVRYETERAIPIESPDGAWLLAWRNADLISSTGLRLYTPDGKLTRTLTPDTVLYATWTPDSTGAFYVSKGALHYVSIPDGEPQMVAENLLSAEPASYVWIQW